MGQRGPIPTPSALRVLRGNPGRRRQTKTEPTLPPGIPDPPAFLSEIALQEWQRVAPALAAAGLMTPLDRAGLAVYSALWGHLVEAERDVKANGLTLTTTTAAGKRRTVPNPSAAVLSRVAALLRSFLVEFGMTPASRARLRVESQPTTLSKVEQFLLKHGAPDRAPADA